MKNIFLTITLLSLLLQNSFASQLSGNVTQLGGGMPQITMGGLPSTGQQAAVSEYKDNNGGRISYPELINFLKTSNDKNKIMILGAIYANGTDVPDDYGNYIEPDPVLSEKYFLQSYKMGNPKALTLLSGLILYNDNMAKLDPKLDKAEKYLKTAIEEGDNEALLLLSIVYMLKNQHEKAIKVLADAARKGDSSAQLMLAIIFQKGILDKKNNKMILEPDYQAAEYYLNKACNNPSKSDKVREFCYSPMVSMESK